MTIIRELADAYQMISDVVRNTSMFIDSVNDGREYLASRHPAAVKEFSELITQMHTTVTGLATVTKVVGAFDFTVEGQDLDRQPARFNDYLIAQRVHVAELKENIEKLKGSSGKVRALRDSLDKRAGGNDWTAMFGLIGTKDRQRAAELASVLSIFYADDMRLIEAIRQMLHLAETAVDDVQETLAPKGLASPVHVRAAAEKLNEYAYAFMRPQHELDDLAAALNETQLSLASRDTR